MTNSSQLLQKEQTGGYSKIYPLTYIQGIIDADSQHTLSDILSRYNHIYIPFHETKQMTRLDIPEVLRRYGLWVSYEYEDTLYTEWFKMSTHDAQVEELWLDDNNWEMIPNLEYINDASLRIPNGCITPDKLSPALQQLINEKKEIHNIPDDEDLEQRNNVISFKDRCFYPGLATGLGRKILRKNWTYGRNILTQDMINEQGTIYEIRYDFDLDGKTIEIPRWCYLLFNGGSIKNGTLKGNNTYVLAPRYYIFKVVHLSGLLFDVLQPEWFGYGIDNFIPWGQDLTRFLTLDVRNEGTLYYNLTLKRYQVWNGEAWEDLKSEGGSTDITAEVTSTKTLEAGEDAVATAKVMNNNQIQFTFAIPRGEKGANGEKGEKGDPGEKGEQGEPGVPGTVPNYKIYVYKQSTSKPAKPTGTSLTPEGWEDYPNDSGQWWQCIGTVNGLTNQVIEWSEVLPVNGKDGQAQDGSHVEFRFAVSGSSTEAPALTNNVRTPSGWALNPPEVTGYNYLYMTQATISANDTLVGTWSDPVRISGEQGPQGEQGEPGQDGQDGKPGTNGVDGKPGVDGIPGVSFAIKYCLGTIDVYEGTPSPTGSSPAGWQDEIPKTTETKPYIWCIQGKITYSSATDQTGTYTWSTPFRLSGINGLDGTSGSSSPIVYPAGIYDVNTTYTSTTEKAPYVLDTKDGNYYILKALSWVGTTHSNQSPSDNYEEEPNVNWVLLEGFDAVYAKVGIIPNGLIGSAVFNGEYMFSQQGINPSSSDAQTTDYQNFDADHIYDGTFTPNILLNFVTGNGHLAAGKIKFNADGSGELAGGNVRWDANGTTLGNFVEEDFNIDQILPTVPEGYIKKISIPYAQVSRVILRYSFKCENTSAIMYIADDGETAGYREVTNGNRAEGEVTGVLGIIECCGVHSTGKGEVWYIGINPLQSFN